MRPPTNNVTSKKPTSILSLDWRFIPNDHLLCGHSPSPLASSKWQVTFFWFNSFSRCILRFFQLNFLVFSLTTSHNSYGRRRRHIIPFHLVDCCLFSRFSYKILILVLFPDKVVTGGPSAGDTRFQQPPTSNNHSMMSR